jgi:hypothetical protein
VPSQGLCETGAAQRHLVRALDDFQVRATIRFDERHSAFGDRDIPSDQGLVEKDHVSPLGQIHGLMKSGNPKSLDLSAGAGMGGMPSAAPADPKVGGSADDPRLKVDGGGDSARPKIIADRPVSTGHPQDCEMTLRRPLGANDRQKPEHNLAPHRQAEKDWVAPQQLLDHARLMVAQRTAASEEVCGPQGRSTIMPLTAQV